ncbi:MAG: WXG100 family type VII secretion target [Roseburia sp.]|nr:WXG100 family type VII secretion target [Roseburia sp.]
MAAEIKVTTATLKTKQNELKTLNQKFSKQLEKMDSSEKELTSMWEGDASKSFDKSYVTDTKKMQQLHAAVEQYCEALTTIIKQYEKSESKNVSIATKRTY